MGCSECGLIFTSAIPSADELDAIYSTDYYNSWGGADHRKYWDLKKALAQSLLDSCKVQVKGKHVLDIGCATGAALAQFEEQGAITYGIDVNAFAIQKAKELIPSATLLNSSLEESDFGDRRFDVITMIDVLEHVLDPCQTLAKVRSLLKPGGLLMVVTPDTGSISYKVMGARWPHLKTEHLYYFNRESLRVLFEKTGLSGYQARTFFKPLDLNYVIRQFDSYKHPLITPLLKILGPIIPAWVKSRLFYVPIGEMVATACSHADQQV